MHIFRAGGAFGRSTSFGGAGRASLPVISHDMSQILWVSAETPDRNGGGGQRRQYHQIRAIAEAGIRVDVAALAGPQDHTSVAELARVTRFRWGWADRRLGRNRQLAELLQSRQFAGAVVAHVESVPHVQDELRRLELPWLLDFHNVNSRWHRLLDQPTEAADWEGKEREALGAASRSAACSDEEREALVALQPEADVVVAGHGIDPTEWPKEALAQQREAVAALFGSWQHGPNREAALWITERVWPTVRARLPHARLILAGPGSPPAACLRVQGVEYIGRLPDLAAFLGSAQIVVVPILRGIGARVKFGEALASGAAVVATSAGAEGFCADGLFERADDERTFAEACARLLVEEDEARALGSAARRFALEHLTWAKTSQPLVDWIGGIG